MGSGLRLAAHHDRCGFVQHRCGPFNDVSVGAKLAGVASCDSANLDPSQYPLNGKLKLSYVAKTLSTQAYIRVAGFDPVPGPDVIALTGIVVKGGGVGATVSGEVGFDPSSRLSRTTRVAVLS